MNMHILYNFLVYNRCTTVWQADNIAVMALSQVATEICRITVAWTQSFLGNVQK